MVLLLGAGISFAAGVPSARGVPTALIEGIAAQRGETTARFDDAEASSDNGLEDPGDLAVSWYVRTLSESPSYQAVLTRLGPTQTERQRILRTFFDADEADREQGLKQPTPAHRAIAALVNSGRVQIVITLNFDTLVEQAIRDEGVEPSVVASAADITAMAPLHTHTALVVHLHGQYLTPSSMRNTFDEPAAYDPVEDPLAGPGRQAATLSAHRAPFPDRNCCPAMRPFQPTMTRRSIRVAALLTRGTLQPSAD